MSKKPQRGEVEFGSDSFLDVLANMVGILIILIVIAGVRFSNPPPPSEAQIASARSKSGTRPTSKRKPTPLEIVDIDIDHTADIPTQPAAEPEPDPVEPPAEIADELQLLATQNQHLADEAEKEQATLRVLLSTAASTRDELTQEEQKLVKQAAELRRNQIRLAHMESILNQKKESMTGLLAEFEQAQKAPAATKEVRHRLTPISQTIVGEEVHFRVCQDRVAVIPLTHLVERLKTQVDRQKEWLAKFRRHQGSIGPVDGFSLTYVVERQSLSVADELRYGAGVYRIGVSAWQVVPEPDLEAETAEQALKRGSKFARALQSVPSSASLTFWVYPDSYALFRKLQATAHAEGFIVSARPLPEGVPIAGSPQGSRSAGQ